MVATQLTKEMFDKIRQTAKTQTSNYTIMFYQMQDIDLTEELLALINKSLDYKIFCKELEKTK